VGQEKIRNFVTRGVASVLRLAALNSDGQTHAIRAAYIPAYLKFFPFDALEAIPPEEGLSILALLRGLYQESKEGDFAYAMLRASQEILKEGGEFSPDYRSKLELVVADMWRKMGALAEKDGGSATALIYKKCARSAEAIEMLELDAARILRLAQDPSELRAEAEVIFPELGQAMDKMAVISGKVPATEVGERIRKGLLLEAGNQVQL
jgi:hypothetical protein